MARLLSGRVKVTPPSGVSTDRYSYLKLQEAEPNAGLPSNDGYVLASNTDGSRFWRSAPGASAISGITIKDEGSVVGTASSVDALNFVGSNITATASGFGATITVSDSPTFTDLTVSGIATFTAVKDLNVTGVGTISGLKYPTVDGSANQVMATDGNGNLTLQTISDLQGFSWETNEQDFGLITDSINDTTENGLITDAASISYDLGLIVVTGLIYPTQFVMPSFTVSTLPSVNPAGQMLFVTDETGGAVPAFSDGTNWRRVTDRAIVS